MKSKGQSVDDTTANDIQKLVECSIFDDDQIKDLKATLLDIGEFIKECTDLEKIQPQLDQLKAEAEKERAEKGVDVDVPASFGQKPEDHETFKKITFKSKKRTLEEVNKANE